MAELRLPLQITYQTEGLTPIRDVISALEATDGLVSDAVALLPSLLTDTDIRLLSVSIQRLSQESPLKEIVVAAIWVTSQQKLEDGVVAATDALTGIDVPSEYRTLLALAVLLVMFYGISFAKDLLTRAISGGPAKRMLDEIVADMAAKTGRRPDEVRRVLEAKYEKAGPVKALVKNSLAFFLPSKREGSSPIDIGGTRIEPKIVEDVPFVGQVAQDQDFERFKPYDGVTLRLHAQDMDKATTGWAAVVDGVSEKRLRLKLMPPVEPSALWNKSKVVGDVVVISKVTARGYEPSEVHLTSIIAAE